MTTRFRILPIDGDHSGLNALADEASSDGFGFVMRLMADWASGVNYSTAPARGSLAPCRPAN
jgi:hypothetical protein